MKIKKGAIVKLVAIGIGFIIAFVAIFYSLRPNNDFAGKGKGKDTEINTPKELSATLYKLPASSYYVGLAEASENSVEKNMIRNTDNTFQSATIEENLQCYNREAFSSKLYMQYTEENCNRDMKVYFTENAAYYNVKATMRTESYNGTKQKTGVEASYEQKISTFEVDMDAYIGKQGILVRYNNLNVAEINYKVDNGEEIEDKTSLDKEIEKECFNVIRSNYGKWLNLQYTTSLNNSNTEKQLQIYKNCVKISQILIEDLIKVNDYKFSLLTLIANGLENATNDSQNKNLYKAKRDNVENENKYYKQEKEGFAADLSNKNEPNAAYFYYLNAHSDDIVSSSERKSIVEFINFSNLGNTIIKNAPSAIELDNFLCKTIEKTINNDTTA